MKVVIEIPKEFETDFYKDKFKECFGRVQVDLKYFEGETLCGNYEKETLEMLENAFQNATVVENMEQSNNATTEVSPNYYVTHKLEARYVSKVNANSIEEAIQKVNDEFSDADFGEARDIDGEAILVEDEKGNYVWEK